jgi:hypothetical protein
MFEAFPEAALACGTVAGVGIGIASVIKAYFEGKATLLRAERGDPEIPNRRSTLPDILTHRGRDV